MNELIVYAILFLALLAHTLLAGKLYRKIHVDADFSLQEKNQWKLKALIFPGLFWFYFHQEKKRRNSGN
jgi:hypothetical protein